LLTAEENEILTRVGPGTPMGQVLRRYWTPALLSEELPEPDGRPVAVRLLGEDLVAFRDTRDLVGLLEERCPHRRASLLFARNEECGLRCIYHGWKFDVTGQCVDMPTEPEGSEFMRKVRAVAYPVREVAGVVWAYLGPPEQVPPFPTFKWLQLWPRQSKEWKVLEECNYAQAIEGGIDTAHVGFLHRRTPWGAQDENPNVVHTAPRLEVQYTSYGFRYAAVRTLPEAREYVRITPFILPWYTVVPPGNLGQAQGGYRVVNGWVPRDDYSTWHFQYLYNPDGPIDVAERIEEGGLWLDANYRKLRNRDNAYLQDREAMRTRNYAGVEGIITEDHMANESQGMILDRTQEHLGTTDIAVIAMRRLLLRCAKLSAAGQAPPGLDPAILFDRITSESSVHPTGIPWQELCPLDPALAGAVPATLD